MNILLILNDPPYGTERSYNGLRLALGLVKQPGVELRLFLMADAVGCAHRGQTCPEGFYNLERMVRGVASRGAPVGACGTCMDARGLTDEALIEGVHRSSIAELTDWTLWAHKVISF